MKFLVSKSSGESKLVHKKKLQAPMLGNTRYFDYVKRRAQIYLRLHGLGVSPYTLVEIFTKPSETTKRERYFSVLGARPTNHEERDVRAVERCIDFLEGKLDDQIKSRDSQKGYGQKLIKKIQ